MYEAENNAPFVAYAAAACYNLDRERFPEGDRYGARHQISSRLFTRTRGDAQIQKQNRVRARDVGLRRPRDGQVHPGAARIRRRAGEDGGRPRDDRLRARRRRARPQPLRVPFRTQRRRPALSPPPRLRGAQIRREALGPADVRIIFRQAVAPARQGRARAERHPRAARRRARQAGREAGAARDSR